MASPDEMQQRVRGVLDTLHKDNRENDGDRERFSEAEIALEAWRLDSRYGFLQPIRDKRLAATNGVRRLLRRERKPTVAPHWFTLPGVERALDALTDGPTPLVIREYTNPETGQVMTAEQKQAYLNPPRIDGERQTKGSLNAARDAGYRLAHISHLTEIDLSSAAQHGDGPSPNGDLPAEPETASPEGDPVFRHVRTLHDPRDPHMM